MNYPKEIKVKDYFKIHNYFSEIYGYDRTIILMQVGSFHESYSTNDIGLNLEALAQELDVVCTAKNSKKEISTSNPRMLGFPIHVIDNFVEKLVDLNYTVVVIDQTTSPPNPERKVTRIESPATFISKTRTYHAGKPTFLISLFLSISPIFFAGFPPKISLSGTSDVTTDPKPMIEFLPILTPFDILDPSPIHEFSSICIFLLDPGVFILS